jgi:hypothetical protein
MKNIVYEVEMVEMLQEEYISMSQLPLTPSNGMRRAQILAKLAMITGTTSIALGQTEKGAPAASGCSFCTSLGCTDNSIPF